MRSVDKYWASSQIDWQKARENERIQRILLAEKAEQLAAAEAEVAALTQRVRDLTTPVPNPFRKAFGMQGE